VKAAWIRASLIAVALIAPLLSAPLAAEAVTAPPTPQARDARGPLAVQVLSNRADLISGGDVLVAVRFPANVKSSAIKVTVGSSNVTKKFAVRANGRFEALLTGLKVGKHTITATAKGKTAKATVVNHPNGGPVFSGPQTKHYRCQEGAKDATCNQPATYTYLYKSINPLATDLLPYDPAKPAKDIATTTTDQGVKVPFIVRREDGYQDRDRYTIMMLWQPGQDWKPWAPQSQWNHKLLVTHGGGCGASYAPGDPPLADASGTLDAIPVKIVQQSYLTALGKGFAVASTALDNTGHNCNVALNAESVMMAKERLVEQYGELRYTIGTGCSGGSIAQHTVANAYPGIYQGLITTCSYPDTFTAGAQFADYHLMRLYFENPSRWGGVLWLPTQMAAVEGHLTHINAIVADEGLFKAALNPQHACSGTLDPVPGQTSTRYEPTTNPGGVRCSVLDLLVNQLGRRAPASWGPQEKKVGYGFGGVPFSNEGVLYGLTQVKQNVISAAQFVDLNEKIGGLDVDSVRTDARLKGDDNAIANAYRTGLINEANHLDDVAIINHGGPDPGLAHDYAHAFWTEERLMADQGHTDNRVMWFGPVPLIGNLNWPNEALLKMDSWLSAVEKDTSATPLAQKIVRDRPKTITDRCIIGPVLNALCSVKQLQVLQTRLSTPRQEAGGPTANDVMACVKKPLTKDLFKGMLIGFNADQWSRLQRLYPDGVCDWSKKGRGQGPATTWLRYDSASGGVQYGGRKLGAWPSGSGGGWYSASFMDFTRQK